MGTYPIGQSFIMRGVNLDILPDEILLFYADIYADYTSASRFLSVAERDENHIVWTNSVELTKSTPLLWNLLYTPLSPPRTPIDYVAL